MNKTKILLIAVFLLNLIPIAALAQSEAYLPLTKQEMGKPFPLQKDKIIDKRESVSFFVSAGPSGVHFDSHVGTQSNLVAYGKDKNGNDWRVVIPESPLYLPMDIYKGDLDKNGITDVIIMMPTGGNGLAPSVHFIALMFDDQGRPIPFEADGYFEPLENGIDSLVDMNGDGRAELIYMNFNDGYWITNIYTCQNGRWSRIQGAFGKRNYPLFTRFTSRPNRKAVIPKPGHHPFAPNLSNDKPILEGFLTSFNIPDTSWTDVKLTIEDLQGVRFKCTPAYWYNSAKVIFDTTVSRQIAHLAIDDKDNASYILKNIIEKKIKVLLYGQRYQDKCSPETVWATQEK